MLQVIKKNLDQAIDSANNRVGKKVNKNFLFIEGDIRNFKDCIKAIRKKVDFVLHQAALGSVPRSIKDPITTNSVNIDGFLNILQASKDMNIKKLVYASSSAVYGDYPNLPKVEHKIGNPLSPYALTKFTNELYANIFAKNYNLKSIGLRYFNIFGQRQDPNGVYAAVIPKWILGIKNEIDVKIYGDGLTSRDFCFIDNAVQANILAAVNTDESAVNQVYNIAVNDKTNLNKLYKIIEKSLSRKKNYIKKKTPIYSEFRDGDIKHSLADINKAKKLLGYDPVYKIKEGLEKTIDWYIRFYN